MTDDRPEYPPVFSNLNNVHPDLTLVKNLHWVDKIVLIEGYHFENCTFEHCNLLTEGGAFELTKCALKNDTRIVGTGARQSQ